MSIRNKQIPLEWGLVALLAGLCAVLSILQYRWTGEVAEAEATRLRGDLHEQALQLGRAFDAELVASSAALLPSPSEITEHGRDAAHLDRLRQWLADNPRPIFKRIGVAVPMDHDMQLFLVDQRTQKVTQADWPSEWMTLREGFMHRFGRGGPMPFNDSDATLLEFPVFEGRSEIEWLVLELDLDYARQSWLPELTAQYLNPDSVVLNEIEVRTEGRLGRRIYLSGDNEKGGSGEAVSVQFNHQGHVSDNSHDPFHPGRWTLTAWPRAGALEAIVSASRRRNLAVALAVNGLILLVGGLLVRYTRRSRQLAEAQMNFVANVSHELRTPLTVIRGAAHNLRRGVVREPSQIEQYSSLILEHTGQLTNMIEQLLELAGARKSRPKLAYKPVALADVLKEAIAAAQHDTQDAACAVELALPPTLPALSGDASALRRAFQNLISNAAKHAGQGGWIGVTAEATNGNGAPMIEVRVADRGPGIPESEQSEIFKPFVRGAAAEAGQIRGSGLGLSVVKEIIEAHDGRISVLSKAGQGATFSVRLPVSSAPIAS